MPEQTADRTTEAPSGRPRVRTRWGPLQHRSFRWLLAGQTVNLVGQGIAPVALAFAVLDLGGSAVDLGVVMAAYAAAEVVTVLAGGVLGDRLPRQLMLQGTSALAALVQGALAAALILDAASLPLLAVAGMAIGCLGALRRPSSQALTPQTVPGSQLSSAISLRRLSENAARIIGTGIAGLLVAWVGTGWALAGDAVSYAVAACCFAFIRVPRATAPAHSGLLREVRAGAAEVLRHTWLWLLIVQALVYHLFYSGAQGVLGPIVVGEHLGRPAWGWALSAMMAGFVVGGGITLRWRPDRPLLVGCCFLMLTAAFPLAMAVSSSLLLVLVGAFVHGLGLEIFSVGWDLSIQQNVAEGMLCRVYAFDQVGSFIARPAGLALTGPVAAALGNRFWLGVVAAVIVASTLLAVTAPDVRRLRRLPT